MDPEATEGEQTEEIPAEQLPDVPEESDEEQPAGEGGNGGEPYDGGEIPDETPVEEPEDDE